MPSDLGKTSILYDSPKIHKPVSVVCCFLRNDLNLMIISMYYLCLGLWSLAVQFCSFNLAHSRGHFILPTGRS